MSGIVRDVQSSPLVIANDSTEQVIYSVVVPAGSVTSTARYQMVINALLSTRAVLPGTITLRVRVNGNIAVVIDESPLAGASNVKATCNLEVYLRADGTAAIGGFFAQNAADLLTTPGVRLGSVGATVDLSVDQTIQATIQFATADPANSFTRSIATLNVFEG